MEHLNRLREHMIRTYINLRVGMGLITLALPFVLIAVGHWWDEAPWQCSISAYYWASPTGEYHGRVFLVGGLFAVGAFLYLYKGFTRLENYLLNAAALFAIGVAIFPMQWTPQAAACGGVRSDNVPAAPGGSFVSLHGTCAVLMFVCLFFVVWWCARSTLHYVADAQQRASYQRRYQAIAIVMLASPLIAVVLNLVIGSGTHFIFLAEALGIVSFAVFWLLKSDEVDKSGARRVAMTQAEQGRALPPETAVPPVSAPATARLPASAPPARSRRT